MARGEGESIACSRFLVYEDNRKSKWATSGISSRWYSGEKRRGEERPLLFPYQTPLVAGPLFQSSALTESMEQARESVESLHPFAPFSHLPREPLQRRVERNIASVLMWCADSCFEAKCPQICPGMHANDDEMHASYGEHKKVSSFVKKVSKDT